jgi:hypothetical protein
MQLLEAGIPLTLLLDLLEADRLAAAAADVDFDDSAKG